MRQSFINPCIRNGYEDLTNEPNMPDGDQPSPSIPKCSLRFNGERSDDSGISDVKT